MLYYTHMTLDRGSQHRKDPNWVDAQKEKNSLWLLIHENQNLISLKSDELALLTWQQVQSLSHQSGVLLGQDDKHSYFALDVSDLSKEELNQRFENTGFADMRQLGPKLDQTMASIGVLARGLCYWHKTHTFCGRCGHQNHPVEGGHARQCNNPNCMHITFPRTDPAVIMLVTHTFDDGVERCLLGRQDTWPQGVYSTLAGFVDPGESLEQAVEREVLEESGVKVTDVEYIASQPWPFPSSLMLGFIAKATTTDISVEQDELEDAKWFSRDDLNQFAQWGDEGEGFKLTRPDSISRYLVEYWRAQ